MEGTAHFHYHCLDAAKKQKQNQEREERHYSSDSSDSPGSIVLTAHLDTPLYESWYVLRSQEGL